MSFFALPIMISFFVLPIIRELRRESSGSHLGKHRPQKFLAFILILPCSKFFYISPILFISRCKKIFLFLGAKKPLLFLGAKKPLLFLGAQKTLVISWCTNTSSCKSVNTYFLVISYFKSDFVSFPQIFVKVQNRKECEKK